MYIHTTQKTTKLYNSNEDPFDGLNLTESKPNSDKVSRIFDNYKTFYVGKQLHIKDALLGYVQIYNGHIESEAFNNNEYSLFTNKNTLEYFDKFKGVNFSQANQLNTKYLNYFSIENPYLDYKGLVEHLLRRSQVNKNSIQTWTETIERLKVKESVVKKELYQDGTLAKLELELIDIEKRLKPLKEKFESWEDQKYEVPPVNLTLVEVRDLETQFEEFSRRLKNDPKNTRLIEKAAKFKDEISRAKLSLQKQKNKKDEPLQNPYRKETVDLSGKFFEYKSQIQTAKEPLIEIQESLFACQENIRLVNEAFKLLELSNEEIAKLFKEKTQPKSILNKIADKILFFNSRHNL